MTINMSNTAPPIRKKVHRNKTKLIVDTFRASDAQFQSIVCVSTKDAMNLVTGAYNMCNRKGYNISIWRSGCEVFMQKEDNSNE